MIGGDDNEGRYAEHDSEGDVAPDARHHPGLPFMYWNLMLHGRA